MNDARIAFVDGKLLPEEQATVSIRDRAFLYGDGLFATMRVCHGRPFRWRRNLLRVRRGSEFLKIELPFSEAQLREAAVELARLNGIDQGVLRLTLSRGQGKRGYSPVRSGKPTVVMVLDELPPLSPDAPVVWRLGTSSFKLRSSDPLAWFKSCNRLVQVLARAEAESNGFNEALLLNDQGNAVEAASGNLFWLAGGEIVTPPLGSGIFPGVTRSVLFEIAESMARKIHERNVTPEALREADGVFISLSSLGVVEISHIDEVELRRSEIIAQLRKAYEYLVQTETSADSTSH